MDYKFIEANIKLATYLLKEDTATSHYYQSGDSFLPNRISLSDVEFTKAQHKGRMTSNCVVGELKGQFTHKEESILKRFQPYRISTKLFRSDDYPHITGWGTLGITGSDGKISSKSEEGIIIVNRDSENPSLVKIFFMAGVPDDIPNTIPLLMKYASNNI